jgi:mono/diheme cytochrome c family protein
MKKIITLFLISISFIGFQLIPTPGPNDPVEIPPSQQRSGNPDAGFQFIVTGDYVNSGLPPFFYKLKFGKEKSNPLNREGANADIRYDFNVVQSANGKTIIVPNCLQCHGQIFEDSLIVGLGNVNADFTNTKGLDSKIMTSMLDQYFKFNKSGGEAAKEFLNVAQTISTKILVPVKGVNIADRLTAVLITHRDKNTLAWHDSATSSLPEQVIPSDVPAWWLLKKKNAMFYNGFGRGDFGKFLMGAILLTVNDTIHANAVDSHMNDVLAYINSIQPPKYPKSIDENLATIGQLVFEKNCAKCHGTYGTNPTYPNYLIPQSVIGTDSMINNSNYQHSDMVEWFNTSWFSKGDHPAKLVPFNGFIAPPLDGVWITAPYLHNGSIPTIEALLNSKLRPTRWKRNFSKPEYDYEHLGWKYLETNKTQSTEIYDTNIPGYGNFGHYFGDKLTTVERTAVLEYLKTL